MAPLHETPPSLGPYLIGCGLVAGWITFGSIHRDQHSDSILNVLISLQCWTSFVWEQDRFGMAVPLLAIPIRHPLANMLFQAYVMIFSGLVTFFLMARYTFRDSSYPAVGLVGASSVIALTPSYFRFEYFIDTSYGISLALTLWGLILVEPEGRLRPRLTVAFVLFLMGVAHWINNASGLFLGPLVLLRGLSKFRWSPAILAPVLERSARPWSERIRRLARILWTIEPIRGLAVLGFGYAFGRILVATARYPQTNFGGIPWSEWPDAWRRLLEMTWKGVEPPRWLDAMALEAVVGVLGLGLIGRRRSIAIGWSVLSLVATAVTLWLLMGTRSWLKLNAYSFRYLLPSLLMLQTAAAGLAISWLRVPIKSRVAFPAFATIVLLAASAWSYGFPSIQGVRRDVDRACGALTEDLLAAHCVCLAGDYQRVWIGVFHANLVLYEQGRREMFWGLSYRSMPTYLIWARQPGFTCLAGVANGDGQGEIMIKSYLLPKAQRVETRRTITVYKTISPPN